MNHLNYHQLYYFYQIAQAKSLSKASKVVLVSVPALSMQLKELEDQVGASLFNRKGNGLELTEMGHFIFDYAKDIFMLGKELQDTLNDKAIGLRKSKIEVGCEDSIPKYLLENLIEFFFIVGAKVIVREAPLEQLLMMQESFELDLVLAHSRPQNYQDDTRVKQILKENLILVASPELQKKIKDKEVDEIPLIHNLARPLSLALLESYFVKMKKRAIVIAEIEDHQTEIDLARKGHGMVITQPSTVKRYLKEKKLVKLHELEITDEVWLLLGRRKKTNELATLALEKFRVK